MTVCVHFVMLTDITSKLCDDWLGATLVLTLCLLYDTKIR